MDGQALKDGKARVRAVLIDPLVARGMVRKRGQSVEALATMLASLEARLSYLDVDHLAALAEVIERAAGGRAKNEWPAEVSICNWARDLKAPPASDSRLVVTYLQSEAGRAAARGGWLAELYRYLKRVGAPPNSYALSVIQGEADDNRRKRAAIERAESLGGATAADLQWLRGYMNCRRHCLAIVNAKQDRATEGAAA